MMNKKSYGFLFISLGIFIFFFVVFDNDIFHAHAFTADDDALGDYLNKIKIAATGFSINISGEKCVISHDARGYERLFFEASAEFHETPGLFNFLDALFEAAVTSPSEIASIDATPPEYNAGTRKCVFSFIKEKNTGTYAANMRNAHFAAFKTAINAASSEYNLKLTKFYYLRNGRIELSGTSRSLDGVLAFIDYIAALQTIEKFSCITIEKKYDARARQFYYRFDVAAALY